jgi:hypothetical protein
MTCRVLGQRRLAVQQGQVIDGENWYELEQPSAAKAHLLHGDDAAILIVRKDDASMLPRTACERLTSRLR